MSGSLTGVVYAPVTLALAAIAYRFLSEGRSRRDAEILAYGRGFAILSLVSGCATLAGTVFPHNATVIHALLVVSAFLAAIANGLFAMGFVSARLPRLPPWSGLVILAVPGAALALAVLLGEVHPSLGPGGSLDWGMPWPIDLAHAALYGVALIPLMAHLALRLRDADARQEMTRNLLLLLLFGFILVVALVDFVVEPLTGIQALLSEQAILAVSVLCGMLYFVVNERLLGLSEQRYEQLSADLTTVLQSTVDALVRAMERRDPYTAGHQQRVTLLALAVGAEMGLDPHRLLGLRMAGLLHDIGKINIPVEILNKPGRLSDIEMEILRSHPAVGHEILQDVDFPWPVADIILQHHEAMDGNGYPHKLDGASILLDARILSVCDIVEAMASDRPYRPALGLGEALEEIRKQRGKRLDRDVVDACIRVIADGFSFDDAAQDRPSLSG